MAQIILTQIILILLAMIVIGATIYITRYKGKGKPKVGIKRANNSEYFKDYINLQLYWTSLVFMVYITGLVNNYRDINIAFLIPLTSFLISSVYVITVVKKAIT